MATSDFSALSIEDLQAALRDGTLTAVGLAERVIENYNRNDEALGAYKTWNEGAFRAQAEAADAALAANLDFGPLQGMPVSIKDLYGVSGYPTFAGTPTALPEEWEAEGPVVQALRQSLAVVPGKTHTVEFAFGGVGTNPHWPTPRNPWDADRHRVPGGSSAGAGVSLGTGTAVVAVGSDTAGSVRVPASVTGCVGVKTSIHRWSTDGIVPLSPSLDTAGILTRSAADAAIAFAAVDPLTDEHPLSFLEDLGDIEADEFTVGVCDWFFEDCGPGIAEAVQAAIEELAGAGVAVTALELPEVVESDTLFRQGGLAAPEFAAFINGEMTAYRDTLDPNVAARFERIEAIPAVDYLQRKAAFDALSLRVAARMAEVDVLLSPTVPITPPDIESVATGKSYHEANMAMLRNTSPFNLLKMCATTMPVALDPEGMPVGLQIAAPLGEDEQTLAAAIAFEKVLGSARDRLGAPPLYRA